MAGRVTVVGLGPAGADHLLPAARSALDTAGRRFVRTRRHPAVVELEAEGMRFASFDDVYDTSPDLDTAYARMVDVVLSAAATAHVVYAVPGSPAVAERTVELLRERVAHGPVKFDVVPGLSFADLAWARLGVDPMADDARVVDARAIDDAELAGSLLIAQCDHALVVSDVKLALLEHLAPDTEVTVLQRLGLPDEHVGVVALAELDHDIVPDHLTSLFVDAGATGAAHEMVRLFQLAKRLRDPGGCPWDAEQTHHSLTRYLLEESYEVVEAVESLPIDAPQGGEPVADEVYAALADELGDLLYQVVFHAVLAQEADAFTMADVARGVHDKLVRR
ncbi:MAG TPA: SAM-dependent methyltransferase, partial [Acidimicrobiia bacterium]|nr:SAM-dependent methyltransferase [Acidimicrobiia bacterium]